MATHRLAEDFVVEMLTACGRCKHLSADAFSCTAFPKGIPEEILSGDNQHTKPFPGDGGIRYEPVDEMKPA